jgi:hypothetical protein
MDESGGSNSPEERESFSFGSEVVHFLDDDGIDYNFIVGPGVYQNCGTSSSLDDGSKVIEKNDIKVISDEVENLISNTEKLSSSHGATSNAEDVNTNNFSALPKEIILNIFSYFSTEELSLCVAPVCKRWYEIGHDPSLWKELDFSRHCELPSSKLCRAICRATSLRRLNLMGRVDLSTAEVAVFSQYIPLLESVNLGFCKGVNRTVIEYFVRNCPRLVDLNVEGCHLVDDNVTAALPRGEKLEKFNFSHCNLTDSSIILLSSAIRNIVSLNIDGISWISDRYFRNFSNKEFRSSHQR